MTQRKFWNLAVILCVLAAPVAHAAGQDENSDLDRIPESIESSDATDVSKAAPADLSWRMFVENGITFYSYREKLLVPPPGLAEPAWQERLSLDSKGEKVLGAGWRVLHSLRYNVFGQDNLIFPSEQSERLDLRELYASWQAQPRMYVDAGRINLKSGVAVGFNPTDYFKTRAVVDYSSQDPAVQRENRLGAAMLRTQNVWDGGALTLAFAPEFNHPSRIYNTARLPDFEPMFDRTNGQQRSLAKIGFDLPAEISAEILALQADDRSQFGLNATVGLGKKVVAYLEWSGGDRGSLITEALAYGRNTGTIPEAAPRVLPGSSTVSFYQDWAAGASLTTETKVTVYLEYDHHEAGFTKRDWQNWFSQAYALRRIPAVAQELWYIRSYAADQGEPMSKDNVFVRATWTDAFVSDLELGALASISQVEDSAQFQTTATYYVSSNWTLGLLGLFNTGSGRSNWGSLPLDSSLLLKVTRYL